MSVKAFALSTSCLVFAPFSAFADIKGDDVWANMGAYLGAMGGKIEASASTSGGQTDYRDITVTFALPMDAGMITVDAGDMSMANKPGGSVQITYPDQQNVGLNIDIKGEGNFALTAAVNSEGRVTTATGDPGNITYTYSLPRYEFEITGISGSDMPADAIDLSGTIVVNGTNSTVTITEGDKIAITGDVSNEGYALDYAYKLPGQSVDQTQSVQNARGTYSLTLPTDGMSVLNLSDALRRGLAFNVEGSNGASKAEGTQTDPTMGSLSYQIAISGTDFAMGLDEAGVVMQAEARDYDVAAQLPDVIPLPVAAQIGTFDFDFALPVQAGEAAHEARYAFGIKDLTVADDLWNMLDPGESLPRDPADLIIDLSSDLRILNDLMDFMALEQLNKAPLQAESFSLNDLLLSVAGATLTGNGAFTLDNSDMQSFDGIPAPTGSVEFNLVGGNALMDKLVAMGLLPEEQAMGARMMLGMFARPGNGEDTLTSTIDIDGATGAILANGQRIK